MIKPGVRVVRGPDWSMGRQDSGEGHLGTIVYVPKSGSDDKRVTVIWDSGREVRYRAGLGGKYDLRVYDNAQLGLQHLGKTCQNCNETNIPGIRWQCSICKDFSLCSTCYMADKHNLDHPFERFDSPKSTGISVPLRSRTKGTKPTARGLFPGVEVMRGPHWKWKNDDGGDSNPGAIVELSTWEPSSFRGAVKVLWQAGPDKFVKKYRVGAEGCVDVIYGRIDDKCTGGTYYADHLPLVNVVESENISLKPGDKVTVNIPVDKFKKLQENTFSGGWTDDMSKCLSETGTVLGFLYDNKTVRTQYEDNTTFLINRNAIYRVHSAVVGEPVKVLDDLGKVKKLQEGHGGWNDDMKSSVGKSGFVIRIDGDGDMRIKVDDKIWIFNPTCIQPIAGQNLTKTGLQKITDDFNSDESDDVYTDDSDWSAEECYSDVSRNIADLFSARKKRSAVKEEDVGMTLVNAAADDNFDAIKECLKYHKSMIDAQYENKTALQVACFEGFYRIAEFLLQNEANVNLQNDQNEAPIHFAVTGKETKLLKLLTDYKVDVNLPNAKRQTALHIAVKNYNVDACNILLQRGANPNLKDDNEATPMHYVVENRRGPVDILNTVVGAKSAKYETEDKNGYNVLQFAVIKRNKAAVELILKKNKKCINNKRSDGRTALHLSAASDCLEISNLLISAGADKDIKSKKGQTPLMDAVHRGHNKSVDLLIQFGCSVNAQDSDGNTALHIIQINARTKSKRGKREKRDDTQILCSLIEEGAKVDIKNKKGKTVLDLCSTERDRIFIKTLAEKVTKKQLPTSSSGLVLPPYWDDMGQDIIKVVQLKSVDDTECADVRSQFAKTMPQAMVKSVARVQNKVHWEIYQLQRKKMEQVYGIGCSNEQTLFHGTHSDKVDKIINEGLDFRLSGMSTGTLFGKGAYFAAEAKYSDNYAGSDNDGIKVMLVFDVLVGKYCVGRSEYTRPPYDPDNPGRLLDSCVNDMKKPTIFCLFDNNQYYLKYLIKYN